MLTIDLEGAPALLRLLQDIRQGRPASETELEEVLAANAFFVDFYSRWEGSSREAIKAAIRTFDQPERIPMGMLLSRLAKGFWQAVDEMDLMQSRMAWLREIDPSSIAERLLAFLPAHTPLDSIIHITVDLFNNAFVYRGEMGVSLLKGASDSQTFQEVVTHELHHVGFGYWRDQDTVRAKLLRESSGRSVAVQHVQNLLSEGMANFYCTPRYVFTDSSDERPSDSYQARLARLQREEAQLFAQAEEILSMCLSSEADDACCLEAYNGLALDMEDAMLPAGHYLGARMVQMMAHVHPRDRIVRCVQHLAEFLPLYNEAARKTGAFCFDNRLVEQFVQLVETERAR